jgi:hypothetical protein
VFLLCQQVSLVFGFKEETGMDKLGSINGVQVGQICRIVGAAAKPATLE